ncbi:glycosyltransferase [Turicibacter sanguinis]|uniref:glycosyltransferase n=1 Tax=Turicibacter sanguinis TaxID=154288 RepID=UPI0023314C72|nr:glycosyltransferase [Turicibacter sanguinis]MDB8542312.1 glycosyltransferase [Turicibacter sanguinis]
MKILQINVVCGVSSTGRITTDLYKALEEKGHQCLIAYGRGQAPKGINTYKIGNNIDNFFHVARTRLFDKHGFGSKKSTLDLVKKIESYNPDIIHLHNLHGYFLNLEILFAYLSKINKPIVWTLHDCWAFTGHCSHFDYIKCDKWKKECYNCPQKLTYPKSIFFDNSKSNYVFKKQLFNSMKNLHIITVSKWLNNVTQQSFLGKYPNITISNGLDLDIFKVENDFKLKEKYGIEDKFVILGVSHYWNKKKGFDDFIQLSKKISSDSVIILVGVNKKQMKNLPNNVIGIEKTDSIETLIHFYSNSDLLLNLSYEETFGMVSLEAMSCGLPVVTYNTTANPELIGNKCGYIVEAANIDEIIKTIEEVKKIGKNHFSNHCIEHVKMNYKKSDTFEKIINLYEEILSNS